MAYLKTFFAWAADEELIEASPASAVKPLADEVKRDRVLGDSEIIAIWRACGELGAFGRAFRFMLATGQRRTEVGEMTWSEINRGQRLWTLPRERTKADRAHEVPLNELAMTIIDECPKLNDFIFSTGRGATATGAATPIAGWSKAKAALDRLAMDKLREIATERGDDPPTVFPGWRLHDLRRSAATNLAKLGVDRIVISKLLNHAEGGVTGIYDRHARDPEKRMAMDLWGARLRAIIDGAVDTNVVPFAAVRG